MLRIKTILCMLAVVSSAAFAQQTDTRTRVFDSNFKSLRAYVAGNYYAPPVIELGGTDQVVISFDELSAEMQYLRRSEERRVGKECSSRCSPYH